jgi:hypothetical protein
VKSAKKVVVAQRKRIQLDIAGENRRNEEEIETRATDMYFSLFS